MKRRIALVIILLLAAAGLIRDALASYQAGALDIISLGEFWYGLDAPSLNLAQSFIQRYLTPYLWDPVMTSLLLRPTWALPLVLIVFLILWRRIQP